MDQTVKKKKGKGGRPTKEVKREMRTGVRFTRTEYFIVKEKARKAGMRYTGYIRHMAIYGRVISRLNDEERAFIRQLIGMATNINQVAKQAHKEGMLSAIVLFEYYRSQLDNLLNWLRRD